MVTLPFERVGEWMCLRGVETRRHHLFAIQPQCVHSAGLERRRSGRASDFEVKTIFGRARVTQDASAHTAGLAIGNDVEVDANISEVADIALTCVCRRICLYRQRHAVEHDTDP